jgi:zinc transporter 1/2/3
VGIGFATFAVSILPWFISKKLKDHVSDAMAIGSAASSGIILGSAFCHILPEAHNGFQEYLNEERPDYPHKDYPFAELTSIAVFFVLVCIDKLLIDRILHAHPIHEHHQIFKEPDKVDLELVQDSSTNILNSDRESSPENGHFHGKNHMASAVESFAKNTAPDHLRRLGTAYVFLTALSIHSVFDGLGIGAETNPTLFHNLLVPVIIHKLLDGFALGIPIYLADFSKKKAWLSLAFCAAMTPLGIGIGWIASNSFQGTSNILIQAIFLSFSCGSFMYIAFIEVLPLSLSSSKYILLKIILAVSAWGIMSILALWA